MKDKQTTPTSDRSKWLSTFKTLTKMLRSQKSQIESLLDDRKFLEKYIHIQHEHWSAKSHHLESYIAQLKDDVTKFRNIDKSKMDIVMVMKEREILCYKKQSELAESDLEDFSAFMETLNTENLEMKRNLKSGATDSTPVETQKDIRALEGEIRKLKHSYKTLKSEKEAQISALFAEKDFVWNQFKIMENDYVSILNSKEIEVEDANETVVKLQNNLLELQAAVNEKDQMISELKAKLDLDTKKYALEAKEANEKIEQLKHDNDELSILVKEKDGIISKLKSELAKIELDLHNCNISKSEKGSTSAYNSSRRKVVRRQNSDSTKQGTSQKISASAPVHGLVQCSSKRRNTSDSSRDGISLFHSNFKVPKLRHS